MEPSTHTLNCIEENVATDRNERSYHDNNNKYNKIIKQKSHLQQKIIISDMLRSESETSV